MRAGNEYYQNRSNARGIVVDRDPKRKKVKVNFEDEDETVSMWIDVPSRSAGQTKTFMMPDLDDEVWVALDAKGEDGVIIGAKYNEKDAPPHESNDDVSIVSPNFSIHLDKATGNVTVVLKGNLDITAARVDFRKS